MYELDYTPVRLRDWTEYFVRFRETGDIKYYNEFLHFYEPVLDERARAFIRRFELEEYRAEDLKQVFLLCCGKNCKPMTPKSPFYR